MSQSACAFFLGWTLMALVTAIVEGSVPFALLNTALACAWAYWTFDASEKR